MLPRLFFLLLMLPLMGCAAPAARIAPCTFKQYPHCYELANDSVRVVVNPATARIVYYGPLAGPNILWENPAPRANASLVGGWVNDGGEKAWIYPQSGWPAHGYAPWPPPFEPTAPYAAIVAEDHLTITSPPIAGYNLRIARDFHLASSGPTLTITTRLLPAPNATSAVIAPWSIAQLPPPDLLLARVVPNAATPVYQDLRSNDQPAWPVITMLPEGFLLLPLPVDARGKLGLEADLFAASYGDLLFIEQTIPPVAPSFYPPAMRAQVFACIDPITSRLPRLPPYIELEFAGPPAPLHPTDSATMTLVWSLHSLPPPPPQTHQRDPHTIIRILRQRQL